ncbi:MAG: type IV pilin protein [Proteobacteria bacterium]|nr:type IV pilin protein [Pseudomonadota bacterium]
MRANKAGGFTLLELMIVVVVIAVLTSLAFYNYSRYGFRSRRVDGQNLLTTIAAAEERYYTNFNQYTSSITGVAPGGLGFSTVNSDRGYYSAGVALGAGNLTYTLTATPQGAQATDACGSLTLDNTGAKTPAIGAMPQSSNGNCW